MCIDAKQRQRGLSLIEQVVFMLLVGIGVAGLAVVFANSIKHSADPAIARQTLAIGRALMDEILAKPMTWCGLEDENFSTAKTYTECKTSRKDVIPGAHHEADRSDPGNAIKFDNVIDYGNYSQTPTTDMLGKNPKEGYQSSVSIEKYGTQLGLADNDAALKITVTITAPGYGNDSVTLTAYKFRYAPRL
ncbi:MAG: type II secretion system protein [Zoogloeaceae bacterium]|jgi:MSHA pilin protein MshD|nr:type II secretion system protein [Zoogloeaceae bacterium]